MTERRISKSTVYEANAMIRRGKGYTFLTKHFKKESQANIWAGKQLFRGAPVVKIFKRGTV